MRRRVLILLFAALVVGCDNDDVTRVIDPLAPTTEELIIADVYVVRDALEALAADNGGVFPADGLTNHLLAFLPGGTLLENRYTGLATVPIFMAPQWPGEIGVILFADESLELTGYRVVGKGRDGELIRLENVDRISQEIIDRYDRALAQVDTVLAAANSFFAQAGRYPWGGGDQTTSGEALRDFLPNGQLLVNGFSGCPCEPQDGLGLGIPGTLGYLGVDTYDAGFESGFVIETYGADYRTIATRTRDSLENEITRSSSWRLRSAVEEFAEANGGEYPRDIDTDETTAGNTLSELISCTWCINRYTNASAYRDGLATSRGEVGYVPLEYNGIVVGYVINALGLFNEELERFEVLTN